MPAPFIETELLLALMESREGDVKQMLVGFSDTELEVFIVYAIELVSTLRTERGRRHIERMRAGDQGVMS